MKGCNVLLAILALVLALVSCDTGTASGGDDNQVSEPHIHDWGNWAVTTPATCEGKGVETRTCTIDPSHKDTREIPALGHDWGDQEMIIEPSAERDGMITMTCKRNPDHIYTIVIDRYKMVTPVVPHTTNQGNGSGL